MSHRGGHPQKKINGKNDKVKNNEQNIGMKALTLKTFVSANEHY